MLLLPDQQIGVVMLINVNGFNHAAAINIPIEGVAALLLGHSLSPSVDPPPDLIGPARPSAPLLILVLWIVGWYLVIRHWRRRGELLSRAMVVLVAIATTIMCLNEVFQFSALLVAGDGSYVAAFGAAGSHALVMLLMDMHHYGFLIAQIFFGLWLVPLGYLAYTSGLFPKALAVVPIVGGVSYLVDMLAAFLIPDFGTQIHGLNGEMSQNTALAGLLSRDTQMRELAGV